MNSATRFGLKSFASSSKVSLSLSDLRQPMSGMEIATSTSMEMRYVNPRFLPAFILMPSHSMLIVDDSANRRLVAVATLLSSLPASLVSSARPRSRPRPRLVRNRRVIWSYYLPSLYIEGKRAIVTSPARWTRYRALYTLEINFRHVRKIALYVNVASCPWYRG